MAACAERPPAAGHRRASRRAGAGLVPRAVFGEVQAVPVPDPHPRAPLGAQPIQGPHYPYPLDLAAMQDAARALVGTHDFSSFQGSPTDAENPVCTITHLTIERFGDEIRFGVESDRFLKQMVRAIVGTLLEVGRGKLKAGDAAGILAARDRTKAGPTAPAHGLYLVRVDY